MGEALAGRRRWIGAAAAVVVLALIGYGVVRALTAGATEEPAVLVTVAADRGAVTAAVATTGTLQPAQTRSLSFAVAGTVESIAVRPGTTVTPGQVLARVDDADATKALADAEEALADAEDALDEAESSTETCEANTAAAYPSPTAPAPSSTCGQQGPQGGDAILSARKRITQATTALRSAEDALAGATITAPIAGRILGVAGKVGSQVGAGSTFVTLADVDDMQISAAFPEADADRLAVGQKAVVTLADRAGAEFAATVVQADPTGTDDGTMVRYGVLLAFDKAPADLLVGQSAAVRVTTGAKTDVLRVPSTAVHEVAGTDGTVLTDGVPRKIVIGLRGDQFTEVTSGLSEGDAVVRSW
jgi:HlyD family secretion protein